MLISTRASHAAVLAFGAIALAAIVQPMAAQHVVIPQSSLVASGLLYTDMIGGGIGDVVVMTGGGNANGAGDPSGRNDDGFSGPINFGYTLNFFGTPQTQFFANNNGNISFDEGISAFAPIGPTGADEPIISPWFSDVDTRGPNSGVLHLRQDIDNETILTWDGVGFFDAHDDLLDTFQLVVRGPDFVIPPGEGTIGFFYQTMQWEATDDTQTAAVGFGDGAGDSIVLDGSNEPGLNAVVQDHFIWFNQDLTPVTSTPEPGTYGLMAIGLAAMGLVARRRRTTRAAA